MKKKFLTLVIINLIPCIFLLLWFVAIGIHMFGNNISNIFLIIFMLYIDNYIFIFDSIVLLIYCVFTSVKNFSRSFLKYIIIFIIINIFNILVDLFIYDVYCFFMSV